MGAFGALFVLNLNRRIDLYNITNLPPLPGRFGGVGRPRKWPFDECAVGQGFEVTLREAPAARAALGYWKRLHPNQLWRTARTSAETITIRRER